MEIKKEKKCSDCKTIKDINCFCSNRSEKDGKNGICRDCARIRQMKKPFKYRITKRYCWVEGDICYIPTTTGEIFFCDAIFFDKVNRHQWRGDGKGYCTMQIGRKTYLLHRFIFENPPAEIDHINQNKLDNRLCNLRAASHSQNEANKRKPRTNSSGYKGVRWHAKDRKWNARIKKDKIERHLGGFNTPEEAARAYDKAAKELFGEYACINGV